MAHRTPHGNWTMKFKGNLLHCWTSGSTNTEAALAWFEEMKRRVSERADKDAPWAILIDCREWDICTPEQWDANNFIMTWQREHGSCFLAVVYSNKLQEYSAKIGLGDENSSYHVIFFDFDEAYQACLDKLTEAQSQ
ncbi:hypothetical protein L4C34_04230 [Vibrio profundum]|uniref:hypothetical protein n=1 Tax=Vibrio profundum TaxID=2910247 RepID=UPI003D0D25F4